MRCLKNKRGSHVGFVLSFMVFVFFLFFLYVAIEPAVKSQESKKIVFEYLKGEILTRTYGEFVQSTIKINQVDLQSAECFEINFDEQNKKSAIVKDESSQVFNSLVDGKTLKIKESSPSDKFYRIYFSDEFNNSEMQNCVALLPENYQVGSFKKDDYVFEKRIVDIINEYVANYNKLKNELKVQEGANFEIIFTESDGKEIKTEEKEIQTDVYAEKISVTYVDTEANIKSGFITIKVW